MPTVLRKGGFKFFFYSNEHEPKHIHVLKGGGFAKIDLVTLEVRQNYFKKSDLQKILEIVKQNRDYFLRRWDEYFSKR